MFQLSHERFCDFRIVQMDIANKQFTELHNGSAIRGKFQTQLLYVPLTGNVLLIGGQNSRRDRSYDSEDEDADIGFSVIDFYNVENRRWGKMKE